MKKLVIGFFNHLDECKNLENSLLDSGVLPHQFTLYINPEENHFLVSVVIENDAEKLAAKEIFFGHHVINSYCFEVSEEENNYENLKKLISKVAHSEIADSQDIKIKKKTDGITDEVVFGK
jgi:hypothetical protein